VAKCAWCRLLEREGLRFFRDVATEHYVIVTDPRTTNPTLVARLHETKIPTEDWEAMGRMFERFRKVAEKVYGTAYTMRIYPMKVGHFVVQALPCGMNRGVAAMRRPPCSRIQT
jgi:hypothetical protein